MSLKQHSVRALKALLDVSYYPLLCNAAVNRYRREQRAVKTLEQALEFARTFSVGPRARGLSVNFAPLQNTSEILALLRIVSGLGARNLCEIGTANGGTLYLFARAATPDARLVSIDLPYGRFGSGYQRSKARLLKSFASERQSIVLIRDSSHSARTFARLQDELGGSQLDFLLIDGDHTYEGVKADFEMYRTLVRRGGAIAFHDIVPGAEEFVGGVPRFWAETKHGYRHQELVESWSQGGAGIGVLWM